MYLGQLHQALEETPRVLDVLDHFHRAHNVERLALLDEFLCRSMSVLERVAPGWCGRRSRRGRWEGRIDHSERRVEGGVRLSGRDIRAGRIDRERVCA